MRLFVFKVSLCQIQCNKSFIANLTEGHKVNAFEPSKSLLIYDTSNGFSCLPRVGYERRNTGASVLRRNPRLNEFIRAGFHRSVTMASVVFSTIPPLLLFLF
jgi:hypothetical protein